MPVAWDEFEPVTEPHHDTDWSQFEPVKPKEIPLPTFQTPSAEEMFGPGLRQQTPGERLRLSRPAISLLGPPMPTGRGGAQEIGVLPVLASAPMPFLPGPETVAGKALLSYFVGQFALKQPEIIPAIKDAYDKKDWQTLRQLVGEEAFGAAFAGLAGHGLLGVKAGTGLKTVIDVGGQAVPVPSEPLTPGQRLAAPGPITGADLAGPRGAQPPPPPIVERVSPAEAARQAQAMTRTATAAFEPPRLPKPVVPEGPAAAPEPDAETVLPPELGSFDDFVQDLKKRGSGQETRAQIQTMFPGVTISQEAAGDLARAAFGDKWMPGGQPAVAIPQKGPSEREVSPPSPVPPVVGLPAVGVPTQQTQVGAPLGGGQGQEGQAPVQAEAPKPVRPHVQSRVDAGLDPNHIRVIVQPGVVPGDGGYIQVDEIHPELGNTFSSNPEELNRAGFKLPSTEEFKKLPGGVYSLSDALAKIKEGKAEKPPTPEIASMGPPSNAGTPDNFGNPLGTTYYATPEDWAAWQDLQKRKAAAVKAGDMAELEKLLVENERLKNKYGGNPPQPPKGTVATPAPAPAPVPEPTPPVPISAPPAQIPPPPVPAPAPPAPALPAESEAPIPATLKAADEIFNFLFGGEKLTKQIAHDIMAKHHGGTMAEGKFTSKDQSDVIEMAVNKFINSRPESFDPSVADPAYAAAAIRNLKALLERLPTQTTRTGETDKMQQFSTVPTEAYAANWVAKVNPNDDVLEPSAGLAGLGVFAKNAGAHVTANELSPRRRALLEQTGLAHVVLGFNAEMLHALMVPGINSGTLRQPTLVVMNPPFSRAAMSDIHRTSIGAKHVEEALKLLKPGGRLVAIVGEGMAMGKPTFVPWWGKIAKTYNIRANVTVSGEEYRKYGTTFDNQLIVIDKTGPTTDLGKVVTGKAEKVEDLIPMLEGVRNDRPPTEQTPAQPSGPAPTAPGGPAPIPGTGPTPAPTGQPGPGRPRPPASGGQRPAPQGGTGLGTVPTPPTQRPAGPPRPSGPPTGPQPAPPAPVGPPSGLPAPAAGPAISVEHKPPTERKLSETGIFTPYVPVKVHVPGTPPHPAPLVESTSMAAVEPVDPTYKPSLNKEAVAFLSDEQMENIIYAGQAHEKFLPTGERQGYFIGDGTGVGKGAEISGIFQDNENKGRVKGLWVSAKQDLLKAAQRDFKSVGSDPKNLIDFRKGGGKMLPGAKSGVGFITYTSLTNNFEGLVAPDPNAPVGAAAQLQPSNDPQKPSRIRLFHQWVGGSDFDGVIAFDEAHYAGNAVDIRGSRGIERASERGKMVVALQALFPKARIVYVSATGATDVANLSYADRLGIWGPGTPFPNKLAFVNTISASGLSAMEIVARDLKATGKYLARSLSFAGIRQDPLPHKLTPDQIAVYDEVSRAWQLVLESINSSMAQTGMANAGRARGSITGKFWGAELRFYNQILTAMQTPTIINQIRQSLEAGNAAVIQLVNTNEATLDRELAKRGAEADEGDTDWLEDLDLTPKQILIEYVDAHYPTQLYAQETDAQGNTSWRPQFVPGTDTPIESPEAVAAKQQLMDKLALIRAPQNPIEMILDTFGEENVAEITGRSQRVVKKLQADGTRKEVREARSHSVRAVEHQEFNDDKRRILIFSEAGGTGFDYHSSRTFVNQRPRDHIGAQMGWRADNAVQGAGRTNRTNQAHPPHYFMPSTDIPGHKRFIATIMRRMSELGALTGGERRAAAQEMFKESDDLENAYAHAAVMQFFRRLFAHEYPDINFDALSKKMGFTFQYMDPATGEIEEINTLIDRDSGQLNISKLPAVHKFLNRVLILEKAEQDRVFKEFDDLRETIIDNAKADGSFDPGTQSLRALAIRKVSDEAVYHDPNSTAKTRLVTIEHDQPVKVIPWNDIKTVAPSQGVSQYVRNLKNGRVFALKEGPSRTLDNGSVVDTWRRISPTGYDILTRSSVVTESYYGDKPNYEIIEPADAKALWDEQAAKAPKVKTHKDTYVVGTFLPIWDRLRLPNPRIWRFTTDTGENILGAHVPAQAVEALRDRLGAGGEKVTPKILFDRVMDGGQSVELANGWIVKRSKVQGEFRIEVKNVEFNQMQEFEKFIGGYMERIAFEPRFFIPTDEDAALVSLEKVLQKSPVVSKKAPPGTAAGPAIGGPPAFSGIPIPLTVEQMREFAQDLSQAGNMAREFWRGFAMKQAPKITDADRETGEAAVQYAAAPLVAREKGLIFAGKVLAGVTDRQMDIKLGTGISEDNLRDLKQRNLDLVYEVEHRDELIEQARAEIEGYADDAREGDAMAKAIIRELRQRIARLSEYTDEDAERFQNLADNTFTFIGKPGSPFPTEQAYRDFMTSAEARTVRERHQQLWREQKDPLYRMASDLDPDAALETRGLDYGARINLKPVFEQRETTGTTVGTAPRSIFIKQTATLKKKNPFAIRAEGQAPAYESSYTELIAHGFEREYPIAKQHEFIRKLIESGNAALSERESPPGMLIKGEPTKGYLQKLRPWRGRFLQVPRKLATEYEAITGLSPAARIPIYTGVGKLLTRLSITGLAEGTTHVANLLSESFTGLGPTANPMINALLKVMGRSDLIYRLPRVLIRGFSSNREEMMELAEIGATKQAYRGTLGWFLNHIDRGSRLVMADIYRGMAEAGWVEDTETGLREFVNQLGNYNKKLQPTFIRWLRDTHVQPFATAMQTFNTQGLRRLLLAPGVSGTSARAKLALHADIAAGLMGFAVLVAFLNYLLSGKAEGPKGTKLGAVGWMGKDGKLQQLDLGLLTGWTRGARITGVQAFVESKRAGLPSNSALMAATRSVGNTALSEVTGPLNRFATVSLTGKRPGVPMVQEAQVVPPQDEFAPLRSQIAENTATALRQSSPLVDAIASFQEGKPISEIAQRQASRFTPRAGLSQETIENLPRIVKASEINAYADALGKQARKVPITERWKFVSDRMTQDGLSPELRGRAVVEMRKRGVFRYQ